LITGLLSNRSIAYGVAKAAGARARKLAFTYQNERFKDRVTEMAGEFGSALVFPCDVASDAEIGALFSELGKKWNALDGLVHAIALAPRERSRRFPRRPCRGRHSASRTTWSSYSFAALARAALPLMQGLPAALVTLTYLEPTGWSGLQHHGARKGEPRGRRALSGREPRTERHSRNAVSAGPIKTLAASGIAGFSKILKYVEENSPSGERDDGGRGNVAAFLLSDLAAGVTGESPT